MRSRKRLTEVEDLRHSTCLLLRFERIFWLSIAFTQSQELSYLKDFTMLLVPSAIAKGRTTHNASYYFD
jgi:hypothetical protein